MQNDFHLFIVIWHTHTRALNNLYEKKKLYLYLYIHMRTPQNERENVRNIVNFIRISYHLATPRTRVLSAFCSTDEWSATLLITKTLNSKRIDSQLHSILVFFTIVVDVYFRYRTIYAMLRSNKSQIGVM